jgi:hypothetical protein
MSYKMLEEITASSSFYTLLIIFGKLHSLRFPWCKKLASVLALAHVLNEFDEIVNVTEFYHQFLMAAMALMYCLCASYRSS